MNKRRVSALPFLLFLVVGTAPVPLAAVEPINAEEQLLVKEAEVTEKLLEKLGEAALEIRVRMDGETAILTGDVPTRAALELVDEVALSVEGVRKVNNRLKLAPKPGGSAVKKADRKMDQEVADAVLESRVKRHLFYEIGGRAKDLEVEAVDGMVSLRGKLDTAERRDLALRATEKTVGVKSVVDLIEVKG
jgi:osmotically-inducible protein OsmY